MFGLSWPLPTTTLFDSSSFQLGNSYSVSISYRISLSNKKPEMGRTK